MKKILTRDFLEISAADRRWRFAVVLSHPIEGRFVVYLRYVEEDGRWRKVATEEAEALLRAHLPEIFFRPKEITMPLQGIPSEWIEHHFSARHRLQEIVSHPRNPLEEKACEILEILALSPKEMGITGSLLVSLQTHRSDIDLLFYKRERFEEARRHLKQALAQGAITEPDWQETYRRRGCTLPFELYLWHEKRKWTKGALRGTKFDFLLVEPEAERVLFDGQRWEAVRTIELEANVTDADGFVFPARYQIDHPEIGEILAFSATYFGQAEMGERVRVRGKLEVNASGKRRIMVGSSREARGEYLYVPGHSLPLPAPSLPLAPLSD